MLLAVVALSPAGSQSVRADDDVEIDDRLAGEIAPGSETQLAPRILYGPDGRELPFPDDDQILKFLESATVLERSPVGQGKTNPERLLLEHNGIRTHAIFHDVNEAAQNVQLGKKGIVPDFRDSFWSQVAGYHVSSLLGMDNVPPAVVREADGVEGSAALWIENGYLEFDRRNRELPHPALTDWNRRLADIRVFDNLIANIDRNQTNILFDSNGKIWMIDTTRAFGTSRKLPHAERVSSCSRSLWAALNSLDREKTRHRLRPYLSSVQINAMFRRLDRLIDLIEEKIEQRGSDRVLFTHGSPDDSVRVHHELPPGP